jgi:hypothetical protein
MKGAEKRVDRILQGLNDQFRIEHDLGNLKDDELFESFCAFCVFRSIYEDELDPEEFRTGGGGDLAIDAAAVLINGDLLIDASDVQSALEECRVADVHFILVQAKTSSSFDGKVITDLADNLITLYGPSASTYPLSPELVNFHKCIEHVYEDISKLRQLPRLTMHYTTSGRVTGDDYLEQKRQSALARLDDTNLFRSVDFQLLGARELRDLYQRATTAVSVDFSMQKRISLPKISGVEQAFLGLLPAVDLIKVLTDKAGGIRKSVFFENVRDFQDYNSVNLEIQDTLRDADRRERFAVLNNGITIVAREIRTAGDDVQIADFQVVNGCQTCHVLFDEQDNLGDSVWVSVKLIESKDEDVISGIIAATNRQTAVTDEDLEAKERFHKELEDLFRSFKDPERLYYERRSAQYAPQVGLEKTRIVSRGQLTRAYAAVFLGEAARAGRFYRDLREARKNELFQDNQSTFAYYTSAAISYRIEWMIRNKKIDRKYGPAKYHLMSAFKTLILGDVELDRSTRKAERQCKEILEVVWDAPRSTELVKTIISAVDEAISVSRTTELVRDFMRSQRFTNSLNQVLADRMHT